MDLGLTGKTALVLGASQGMGAAIAQTFGAEGCNVVLGARNQEKIEALAAQIAKDNGVEASALAIDLTDKAAVADLAGRMKDEIKPDILIYNTGGPPPSGPLGVADEVWQSAVQSLLMTGITLCEAAVEVMRPKGWGRIVTIASSGVVQPIPFIAVSNTMRAGFAAYSKTLSGAVGKDGITVNMVLPGVIDTERNRNVSKANAEREGITVDEIRSRNQATIPAGRFGTAQEFADVTVFVASERASYVTGSMIRIDGGSIRGI